MLKKHRTRLLRAAVLTLAAILLSACSPFVDQDQPLSDSGLQVTLAAGQEVGQTFVAQNDGLNGVEFSLANPSDRVTTVEAHLRAGPDVKDDLGVGTVALPAGSGPAMYRFSWPTLSDGHNRYLYVALRANGEAQLQSGPSWSYLNGSLYKDGQPSDGQALFRLTYEPGPAWLELLRACVDALRLAGGGVIAWVIPGWALLSLGLPVVRRQRLSLGEKIALSAGIGVGLYPVLILWASTVGLRLGNWLYWGPVVLAVVVLAWQLWRGRLHWPNWREIPHRARSLRPSLPSVLLVIAGLAVFFSRLLVIRGLDAPSWGDSVQHAVMTQLISEHQGLFSNWQPYAAYQSLSVQFGFAANAAVIMHWLNLTAAQAALVAGQLLSGLAIIALYPLALRLSRGSRWAGVAAVIVAGLLSAMPAFYVNWGRYAQLAGQVVLPVALWLLWEVAEQPAFSIRTVAVAGLALAGMMLSYYRMPYYYAAFVLSWLLCCALPQWRGNVGAWAQGLARLAGIAAVGGILVAPWLSRVSGSTLAEGVEQGMVRTTPLARVVAEYQIWRTVADYVPLPLLLAAAVALVWALFRRDGRIVMLALWVAVMASLVAGRLINVPGTNLLQSFAVLILLYMPVGLVTGWLAGQIASWLARRLNRAGEVLTAAALAVLVLVGARIQLRIVQPGFIMVTRPDMQAMAWIEANTPQDAVFLTEAFRIYNGSSAVGSDAGWWIPLLGKRSNTVPPQYALLNEKPTDPAYSRRVVELVAALESAPPGSDAGLSALCRMGVTHVYIGQTQGQTGFGVKQLFGPTTLLGDPHFTLIYHQDRVYVFAVASHACDVWAKVEM